MVDGDTINVLRTGEVVTLRLIGVDTPETVHPTKPVECYGKTASRFTKRRLEGASVELEYDVQRLDRYGRTLAYVWIGDELFNETLLARGFAQLQTIPPDVKYVDRFRAAQRGARKDGLGLWGKCQDEEKDEDGGGGGGNCHSSYVGECLDPDASDYDCAGGSGDGPEYVYHQVRVVGPDEFRLDADNDGFGCDTLPPP
ncbi:MAG: thermonuclease family protein [Actinomycetota bacterium]